MYAIVKARVLNCGLADMDRGQNYLALNENLAITVGMSLLRAFVLSSIDNSDEFSKETKELTDDERNYNILSLANTLFLLETHTLQVEAVHKQSIEKKRAKKKK